MEQLKRYYEILGLPFSASLDEIKKAFIDAEQRLQQDFLSQDPVKKAHAQEKLHEIYEAHEKVVRHFVEDGPPEFLTDVEESEPVQEEPPSNIIEAPPDIPVQKILESEESPVEKAAPEIPSAVESLLTNKTVNIVIIAFLTLLVALSAGALIGVLAYKKSEKKVIPEQPVKQAVAPRLAPVFHEATSAVKHVQQEAAPAKGEDKRAPVVKRHKKKRVVKGKKHMVSGRGPTISQESLEKTMEAAKQGNAEAQYRVGSMFAKGIGVKKDREEAVRWYRRAASQGNVKAQEALEIVYE